MQQNGGAGEFRVGRHGITAKMCKVKKLQESDAQLIQLGNSNQKCHPHPSENSSKQSTLRSQKLLYLLSKDLPCPESGQRGSRMASSNTLFKFLRVKAERSKYLWALISFAAMRG